MQKRVAADSSQGLVRIAEPILETERLIVRLARADDVPAIVDYWTGNRHFLSPWEPIRTASFYTDSFWTNQVARSRSEWEQGKSIRLILVPRSGSGEILGVANFTEIVRGVLQACFLGYSLSESAQGQGYMHEALRSAVSFAFRELSLHRIQANYMPHNVRSARLLRRLGFNVEGYARDYLRIGGKWEDHVLTSLTNPDWHSSS